MVIENLLFKTTDINLYKVSSQYLRLGQAIRSDRVWLITKHGAASHRRRRHILTGVMFFLGRFYAAQHVIEMQCFLIGMYT